MRIHAIRWKNLNSLVGEWALDFTGPAFQEGIFTITGPTGAGKTTILDALCLALYGITPRLRKITQSTNEIMSRQTDSCFAEVTFAAQDGVYRAYFSQSKTKKGELRQAKRELVDARTGVVLESKVNAVAAKVIELTGMDFEQFTRSMLLAQGGFAAFLKASPADRAQILEKITGTEIYTTISVYVHERQRAEREQVQRLTTEQASVHVLTDEEEAARNKLLADEGIRLRDAKAKLVTVQEGLTWQTLVQSLVKEVDVLRAAQAEHDKACAQFAPEAARLERAGRAEALRPAWSALCVQRRQTAADQAALVREQQGLPGLEQAVVAEDAAFAKEEAGRTQAKEALEAIGPLLQRVRALDGALAVQKNQCVAASKSVQQMQQRLTQECAARDRCLADCTRLTDEAAKLRAEHEQKAGEAALEGMLAGLDAQLQSLTRAKAQVEQKAAACASAKTACTRAAAARTSRVQASARCRTKEAESSAAVTASAERLQAILGERLLREYREEKEHLLREVRLLRTIQDLEEERGRLVAGKPCPLCGSCEHPYAHGAPKPDATEARIAELDSVIKKAEAEEATKKAADATLLAVRTELAQAEKLEVEAVCDLTAKEEMVRKVTIEHAAACEEQKQVVAAIDELVRPLGLSAAAPTLRDVLVERLRVWKNLCARLESTTKALTDAIAKREQHDAVVAAHTEALTAAKAQYTTLTAQYQEDLAKRTELFGNKNADAEERKMQDNVRRADVAVEERRKRREAARLALAKSRNDCTALEQRLAAQAPENARAEAAMTEQRVAAGFAEEADFTASLLDPKTMATLTAQNTALQTKSIELAAQRTDRETRLAAERAKQVTELSLQQLNEEKARLETVCTKSQEEQARLSHELAVNTEAKQRRAKTQEALTKQQEIYRRWDALHALIGSNDGKRYRDFAQALTFEMLLRQANVQLAKMTDRYLLVADENDSLELNVVDSYQADSVRSIKNLSGGESFLVSLALALGLSHFASRTVRVESLFLDEGFGTLDEETLDTVLETLASLREDGTLIGVISHIQALQDRISTQIRVEPVAGGRSVLQGPGVEQR